MRTAAPTHSRFRAVVLTCLPRWPSWDARQLQLTSPSRPLAPLLGLLVDSSSIVSPVRYAGSNHKGAVLHSALCTRFSHPLALQAYEALVLGTEGHLARGTGTIGARLRSRARALKLARPMHAAGPTVKLVLAVCCTLESTGTALWDNP